MFGNLSQLWCHHWQTVKLTSSYFPLSAHWRLAFRQILSLPSLPPITLKKSDSGKKNMNPLTVVTFLHFCVPLRGWPGGQRTGLPGAGHGTSFTWLVGGERFLSSLLCNWKTSTGNQLAVPFHMGWWCGRYIFHNMKGYPPAITRASRSPIPILQFPFLYFIKLTFLGSTPGQRIRNLGDFSGHCPSGHNWKHLKIKSVEKSL